MLEILIMIGVVKGFCSAAETKGRSKVLWGIIGAVSYYIPCLVTGILILPLLFSAGFLPFINEQNYLIYAVVFNLLVGIFCCALAYFTLRALPDVYQPQPHAGPAGNVKPPVEQGSNPYRPFE